MSQYFCTETQLTWTMDKLERSTLRALLRFTSPKHAQAVSAVDMASVGLHPDIVGQGQQRMSALDLKKFVKKAFSAGDQGTISMPSLFYARSTSRKRSLSP